MRKVCTMCFFILKLIPDPLYVIDHLGQSVFAHTFPNQPTMPALITTSLSAMISFLIMVELTLEGTAPILDQKSAFQEGVPSA